MKLTDIIEETAKESKVLTKFERFMWKDYLITPTKKSYEVLLNSGFEISKDPEEQYKICNKSQKSIQGRDVHSLMARVYSLALPFEFVLDNLKSFKIKNWSSWLGVTEIRLAKLNDDYKVMKNLYEKSIEHLLISRENKNYSPENASYLGDAYLRLDDLENARIYLYDVAFNRGGRGDLSRLGEYNFKSGDIRTAMHYLKKSRADGKLTKWDTSFMSRCYSQSGDFENALKELYVCLDITKKEPFDSRWTHILDHVLEDFSIAFEVSKYQIGPDYRRLRVIFGELYKSYMAYIKENDPLGRHFFKVSLIDSALINGSRRIFRGKS